MNAYIQTQPSAQARWSTPLHEGILSGQLVRNASRPSLEGCPPKKQEHAILRDMERQMADAAAHRNAGLAELKKSFVLPDDSSVSVLLSERQALYRLLLESVPELERFFGQETVFELRASLDSFGAQTLYAVALWPGAAADARAALADFDEEWWLHRSHRAAGYLTFTYELV